MYSVDRKRQAIRVATQATGTQSDQSSQDVKRHTLASLKRPVAGWS